MNVGTTVEKFRLIQNLYFTFSWINIKWGYAMNTNTCSHWACNKADNTCVGCGTIICPICLKEPVNCKCENKDICCTS